MSVFISPESRFDPSRAFHLTVIKLRRRSLVKGMWAHQMVTA